MTNAHHGPLVSSIGSIMPDAYDGLSDIDLLHQISVALINEQDRFELYGKIVDAAVTITGSQFGTMQLLCPSDDPSGHGGQLQLLAQRGLPPEAIGFWKWVNPAAYSSHLDEGTTFSLYLPRATAPNAAQAVLAPDEVAASEASILVVEDNDQVGEFASQPLSDLGFSTRRTANAPDAIAILERDHGEIDIVFSDVVMLGMDRVELCRQIRSLRQSRRARSIPLHDRRGRRKQRPVPDRGGLASSAS